MSLIDDLMKKRPVDLAKDSLRAQEWLRQKGQEFRPAQIKESTLLTKDRFRSKPFPGHCYMFNYDPKGKATLPYYDRFPLVFPFHVDAQGFTGINVHYLSPMYRAKLLDALQAITNNAHMNDDTRVAMSYKVLSSSSKFRYVNPCVKRYLFSHMKSKLVYVHPSEWDLVVMLPLQRFQGATAAQVWADSKQRF